MTSLNSVPTVPVDNGPTAANTKLAKGLQSEGSDGQESAGLVDTEYHQMEGWRLSLATISLLVLIFLVQMESSIASTTLPSITDHCGGYEKSSWVFTAYMLTYCGFQMIWAKGSDISGRRFALLICTAIFTISSALCGASQSLIQLIQFRWMQGIGACGIFAIIQVSMFELYPPHLWPVYISIYTAVIALSVIAGPLIGGAITEGGTWRWIFLLNVPPCLVLLPTLYLVVPRRLESASLIGNQNIGWHMFSSQSLRRVDVLGSFTLLGASLLLSTGLQQAEAGSSWRSAIVISLILCSIPFVVVFLAWEYIVTTRRESPEPVFPWRFFQSRIQIGMILNSFLVGAVLFVCTVQIPQKFMTAHGLSPFSAAIKLLSFGVLIAGGSSVAATLMGKFKIPPCWVILFGTMLQVIGLVFLTQIDNVTKIAGAQYVYQAMAGLGVGFLNAALTLLVPYVMDKKDLATGTAAISQFRMLGGLIGLSIAASLSTPRIKAQLLEVLPPAVVKYLLENPTGISSLEHESNNMVRGIFSSGFKLQIQALVGFAVAQVPTTLLMWTNQVAEPDKVKS